MGPAEQPPTTAALWRFRFAQIVVAATFLLILVGGNVTSKGAGLAVPDWPMSFNSVNPSGWTSNMDGTRPGVRDEHFHRLVGATIGILVVVLAVWLWRVETRNWVRTLGVATLIGVILQGALGGVRVIMKTQWHMDQAIWFAILHGCVAQAFFCLTIFLAMVLSPTWNTLGAAAPATSTTPPTNEQTDRLRTWTAGLAAVVFLQLILGALFRHTGLNSVGVVHVGGALLVGGMLIQAASFTMNRPESERLSCPTITLFLLYGLQIILGVTSYLSVLSMDGRSSATLIQTYAPTIHVGVGAIILGVSFVLAVRAFVVTARQPSGFTAGIGEGEVLA